MRARVRFPRKQADFGGLSTWTARFRWQRGATPFHQRYKSIARASTELFEQAAGPKNFDVVEGGSRAESKVEARVAGREIASSCADFIHLLDVAGCDGHSGADRHPVTLRAHQVQRDPVVVIRGFVEEKRGWSADVEDEDVEFSVVIDISQGSSPPRFQRACV